MKDDFSLPPSPEELRLQYVGGKKIVLLTDLMILTGASIYLLLALSSLGDASPRALIGPAMLIPLSATGLLLIARNRHTAAIRLLLWGFWLTVTVSGVVVAGLRTALVFGYPLVVLASFVLGRRTVIAAGAASVAAVIVLGLAEHWTLLPPPLLMPLFIQGLIYVLLLVAATVYSIAISAMQERVRLQDSRLLQDSAARLRLVAEQAQELRLVADNVPAMICAYEGMICRFANRRYAQFYGLDEQSVIGRHLREVIGEDAYGQARPWVERVLAGEQVEYHGRRASRKFGERHLEIRLVPDQPAKGKAQGFYGILFDVTEQERAAEALRKQKELYEALLSAQSDLDEGVAILDAQRIVYANDAFCRLAGYSREEIVALPSFMALVHPDEREFMLANHGRRMAGEQFARRYQTGLLRRDGSRCEIEIAIEKLNPEDNARIVAIINDVTEQKSAQEALRRSEMKFSKVFSASPLAIAITRLADGRYLDVNGSWLRIFGWARDEVIGRTSLEIGKWLHADERDAWAAALRTQGRVTNFEVGFRTRGGDVRQVLLSAESIELAGEQCALVMLADITDRLLAEAALRESESHLREAQHIGHFGSWELDLARDAFTWSEEIDNIFEIRAEQGTLHYADFIRALHPEDREAFERRFREIRLTGREDEFSYRLRMRDGRIKHVHVRCATRNGEDGRPLKVLGTTQDITEQVLAREEIRLLNSELESRVQARTAELRSANRELESFAYSISHDLRAPLRGIDGFSQMLLEEYADKLDAQGRGYLDRVRRAAQRMGTLIDDILELSRVTRREMRRERVDLSRIAREVLEEHVQSSPPHRPSLSIEADCVTVGDPQLLRVLMQNLLENAWKYTARTQQPRIEFGREMSAGETVFYVRDNGVGFDMQYAERLFHPFQRLHKPEEFEGTGIGLATVARIAHRHGGRVWAESTIGQGATFRFTLGRETDKPNP